MRFARTRQSRNSPALAQGRGQLVPAFPYRPARAVPARIGTRSEAAFTLAEVLAAMLFLAIVIPVAVQGLRIASLAGEVAERKAQAVRIAERVLNESMVATNLAQVNASGTVVEGLREFRYNIRTEPWDQHMTNQPSLTSSVPGQLAVTQPEPNQLAVSQVLMNILTVEVLFPVQGRDYSVSLSTLTTPEL